MAFIVSEDGPVVRPSAPAPAAPSIAQAEPKAGDMAVLVRVLPVGAADQALTHLSNDQVHKLAVITAELETLKASPLLVSVPATVETAHQVADISKQIATAVAELERSRTSLVKPHNDKVKAINGLYKTVIGPLETIRDRADDLAKAYLRMEREREQREEAERQQKIREAAERQAEELRKAEVAKTKKAREAAQARAAEAAKEIVAAEVKQVQAAPTAFRSDSGTLSLTKRIVLVGFDPDKIPAEYWRRPAVLAAVHKELAAAVRSGNHDIAGCTIGEEEGTAARA